MKPSPFSPSVHWRTPYLCAPAGLSEPPRMPSAIEAVFPKAQVQLCIVPLVRNCLHYVSWKERKAVAADLKPIYGAPTSDEGRQRLEGFAEKWDGRYPSISQIWRRNWEQVSPFFAYPWEIRKVNYTTNAVES